MFTLFELMIYYGDNLKIYEIINGLEFSEWYIDFPDAKVMFVNKKEHQYESWHLTDQFTRTIILKTGKIF